MARPIKQGLDYFPLDVDIDQDDKIAMIEALHGIEGFGVVIKLLSKVYKEGYFYEWTDREQLLFSKRVNVNINTVSAVVNDCLKEGLFHQDMYDKYSILTSKGIQKRYLEAVKRRKQVIFIERYFLISDIDSIIGSNKIDVLMEKDDSSRVNVNINPHSKGVNVNKSTQRKGKERKEKESNKDIVKKFSILDMENAKLLFELMQQNNPDVRKPNLDKWADEFRIIRERRKKSDEQVKYMIHWTQNDSFWKSNILSPSKLKDKWDSLVLRIQEENAKKKQQLAIGSKPKSVDWEAIEGSLGDE